MITITITSGELIWLMVAITGGIMLGSFLKGFWKGYKERKVNTVSFIKGNPGRIKANISPDKIMALKEIIDEVVKKIK